MTDLKGKKFGVWSHGAGATKALQVLAIDAFKLDLNKDTQVIEVAGPALMALLDKGEVDAMFNLSSLSITAASQPDKYRVLFSPDDYWKEKTGERLVWSAPTIAWRDWVDETAREPRTLSPRCTNRFNGCGRTRTKPSRSTGSWPVYRLPPKQQRLKRC